MTQKPALELLQQQVYPQYTIIDNVDEAETPTSNQHDKTGSHNLQDATHNHSVGRLKKWAKTIFWVLLMFGVPMALAMLVFPTFLNKVLIPYMDWEANHFKKPYLALILIASMALFPLLIIPTIPSMWLSGMTFSYGLGFVIIMLGTLLGTTLPFMLARLLLREKIQEWIHRWPKWERLIKFADQGDWFQQYKVILILRLSPIPYPIFNYVIATTNVGYGPYIFSSATILVPEAFITIYSGKLLKSYASFSSSKEEMSTLETVYNGLGLLMGIIVTIFITIYGKKALEDLQRQDQLVVEDDVNDDEAKKTTHHTP